MTAAMLPDTDDILPVLPTAEEGEETIPIPPQPIDTTKVNLRELTTRLSEDTLEKLRRLNQPTSAE